MKFKIILLILLAICFSAQGLLDQRLKISTSTRYGHDDNIFSQSVGSEIASDFISQVFTVQAFPYKTPQKNMAVFWSPEIRYRAVDDEVLYFQNMVGMYSHKISPRLSIDFSSKFNISDKEPSLVNIVQDMYYYNNSANLNVTYAFSRKNAFSLGVGHNLKRWSDNLQLTTDTFTNSDFDELKTLGVFAHELQQGKLFSSLGVKASSLEYQEDRGGLDSVSVFAGIQYLPIPIAMLNLDVGFKNVILEDEYNEEENIQIPTFLLSLMTQLSKDMSITASVSYDTFESSLPQFNMRESYKYALGLKYKITPRISVSQNLMIMESVYTEDYLRYVWEETERDDLITVVMTNIGYNIDELNAVEFSYMLTKVNSFATPEVLRNKVYLGYKLSF
tara:strand:+ start:321 stop:1490 length:1170 start_codon:yes stop_codon:yes gene_type:complete